MGFDNGSIKGVEQLKSFVVRLKAYKGIQLCAIVATVVLSLNFILAVVAFSIGYSNSSGGGFLTVPLYVGSCSTTRNWSSGLHLLINGLGTLILSTSNYCAQYLAAPTREDIDKAHARGSWLDIGVPSLSNILTLETRKRTLWVLLMVSTIPIHMLFVTFSRASRKFHETKMKDLTGDIFAAITLCF